MIDIRPTGNTRLKLDTFAVIRKYKIYFFTKVKVTWVWPRMDSFPGG